MPAPVGRRDRRAHQLEEAVRAVARIDERQLAARRTRVPSIAWRESAAEKSMLLSATARRRPSLSSSSDAK